MDLKKQFEAFQRDYPYREIRRDGRSWRYRVGGTEDGPAVLVLTGATMVPDPLFVVISELGSRYRVIAPAYPPATHMNDLVEGVITVLDAEHITAAHVVGSSFGGYIAQCLVRAHPDRVDKLVLAQTGVRHFAGPRAITSLKWMLQLAPTAAVKAFNWRMWQALLVDLGEDEDFWMALLRDILDHQLTKKDLVAVMAAMADFTGHHQPVPGDLPLGRRVLVLASEHDRAFAKQAADVRAVYPEATFHTLVGAGHGALFTHTGAYLAQIQDFLADATGAGVQSDQRVAARPDR
jgi:pimeloyl-ACP methyl ester carboxylesterase